MEMRVRPPAAKRASSLEAKKAGRKSASKKVAPKKLARKAIGGAEQAANKRIDGLLTDLHERGQELTKNIDKLLERLG